MLTYPDFSKPFQIYTDASEYQLGGVIMQDGKPIAFFTRKLTKAQKNYTVAEKELLGIVETLKEFRTILLGQTLQVYTDHINLTFKNATTPRILRWRLLIEEFGPNLTYVKGQDNIPADALSRLDREDDEPKDITPRNFVIV